MDPFRVITLDVKKGQIAGLEALPRKVHKGRITGDGVIIVRSSDNSTFGLLPCYQPLDFQRVKMGSCFAIDEDEVSGAVSTIAIVWLDRACLANCFAGGPHVCWEFD
jgi:hypothetical protein